VITSYVSQVARAAADQAFVKNAFLAWGGGQLGLHPKGLGVGGQLGYTNVLGTIPLPLAGLDIGGPRKGFEAGITYNPESEIGLAPYIGLRWNHPRKTGITRNFPRGIPEIIYDKLRGRTKEDAIRASYPELFEDEELDSLDKKEKKPEEKEASYVSQVARAAACYNLQPVLTKQAYGVDDDSYLYERYMDGGHVYGKKLKNIIADIEQMQRDADLNKVKLTYSPYPYHLHPETQKDYEYDSAAAIQRLQALAGKLPQSGKGSNPDFLDEEDLPMYFAFNSIADAKGKLPPINWEGWKTAPKPKPAIKQARCWEGYEPVPGKKPYSDDSCRPKGLGKKKKKRIQAKEASYISELAKAAANKVLAEKQAGLFYKDLPKPKRIASVGKEVKNLEPENFNNPDNHTGDNAMLYLDAARVREPRLLTRLFNPLSNPESAYSGVLGTFNQLAAEDKDYGNPVTRAAIAGEMLKAMSNTWGPVPDDQEFDDVYDAFDIFEYDDDNGIAYLDSDAPRADIIYDKDFPKPKAKTKKKEASYISNLARLAARNAVEKK